MGKRVKGTARNARKNVPQKVTPTMIVDGVSAVKEARVCPHVKTGVNIDKITSTITSMESVKCNDCREVVVDRNRGKGKGKKKGGGAASEATKAIWVCLGCGHLSCGGVGFPTTPQSHATRHAKQMQHQLAIQYANPNLRWCFSCNTLLPVQTSENGEQKDVLINVVKLLKTPPSPDNSVDVEDVWFGGGSVLNEIKPLNTIVTSDSSGAYTVKGLVNLGNTCFFNSILQNLLAMDRLRDHFLRLDGSVGPLTVCLKKLFIDTNQATVAKNVVNPRSLFNSVCAMASQFKGYQQQDSHELLRFLLDGLSNEESGAQNCSPKRGPTFVDAIFGGQTSSTVSCLECGHTSVVYEPYLDLSLPLPIKKSLSKKMPLVSRSKKLKPPPKRRANLATKISKSSDASSSVSDSSQAEKNVIEKLSEISLKEPTVSSNNLAIVAYVEPTNFVNINVNATVSSDHATTECVGDDMVTENTELVQETSNLTDDCWLDYLEPSSSSNNHNLALQDEDLSVVYNDGNCNDVLWEDEPLKVQESEIILLPYEPLTSTSNGNRLASSSVSYEQEPSDFDGFGGLFDEPEAAPGPIIARNISESDSDEVDNTDSPVSVYKCLAHFTTSELLSKTEHAWHCEQCSKVLVEQKMNLKNKLQEPVSVGAENGSLNVLSDSGIETTVSNGSHDDINRVESELVENENVVNGHVRSMMVLGEESCTVQETDSCDVNEHKDEKIQKRVSSRLAKKHGLNGVENGQDDSNSPKVVRDACKRILINRVPPILTIHLKRLSQDARGRLSKLNGHVDFEDIIDLEPYMDPSCKDGGTYKYRLIGVVEHIGTMRGGHYVAYVRGGVKGNNGDRSWYHVSDANVREVSFEEVLRCEAYILFYENM
ncbi:ubiquitin carboxyl-terminal hydrolase 2 [Rutidosis leptorrhynchoides]|uniref:ubiquitin carboxyl-terminal hydrolase 2 n=1 Tax=Rutidosis leptorrhynchoides TaxID=125765 RepID=UPI003A99BBD2